MNLKRIVSVLIFVCALSKIHAGIPPGNDLSSYFTVASREPYARMNFSGTHYLVSVPRGPYDNVGYTAVFDAKTQQLKFKIDKYFADDHLFLSDDGEELIAVVRGGSFTSETCRLTFYNKEGERNSVFLFSQKINQQEDEGYISLMKDCFQGPGKMIVATTDSVYTYSYSLLRLKKEQKKFNENSSFKQFNAGFLNADSLFSISRLTVGKSTLQEQLAKDLNYKIVPSKEEASKAVYFTLIRNEDGHFRVLDISTAHIIDLNTGKWHPDDELKKNVIRLMTDYTYSEDAVPEGVPYWPCNGVMYLKE